MNEERYLKTMLEVVKWDDIKSKDKLITILTNSKIEFYNSGIFGYNPYSFREFVYLRVPIPMLREAKELEKILAKIANDIYVSNLDTEFWGFEIKPKPIDNDDGYIKEHNVTFKKIKEEIIQGIRSAKYLIWIAVAWFSDMDYLNELIKKKEEGLNIRIIVSDEETNINLVEVAKKYFDIKVIPNWGNHGWNRLHSKFCIIDLEYVMHGSFNWSKNANNNKETWATALDRGFTKKFADEFLKLYNKK